MYTFVRKKSAVCLKCMYCITRKLYLNKAGIYLNKLIFKEIKTKCRNSENFTTLPEIQEKHKLREKKIGKWVRMEIMICIKLNLLISENQTVLTHQNNRGSEESWGPVGRGSEEKKECKFSAC